MEEGAPFWTLVSLIRKMTREFRPNIICCTRSTKNLSPPIVKRLVSRFNGASDAKAKCDRRVNKYWLWWKDVLQSLQNMQLINNIVNRDTTGSLKIYKYTCAMRKREGWCIGNKGLYVCIFSWNSGWIVIEVLLSVVHMCLSTLLSLSHASYR